MLPEFKLYATSIMGTRQLSPIGKQRVEYAKDDDGLRIGYSVKIADTLFFKGDDYKWFESLEVTKYRCSYVYLSYSKRCGDTYQDDWRTGRLSLNSGEWDKDAGTVAFKTEIEDDFACYENNKEKVVNLLDYVSIRGTVNLTAGVLEYYNCTRHYDGSGTTETPSPCPQTEDGWTLYYEKITQTSGTGGGGGFDRTEEFKYARFNLGGGVYQPAIAYNPVTTYNDDGTYTIATTTWQLVGASGGITSIDNGMKAQACFEAFLDLFCPGKTLKSEMFQWNPDTPTTTNYVTNAPSKVLNLYLFQKTDVRTPDVDNAVKAETTWEDLLNDWCTTFNCQWDMTATEFRIEHYSWWNRNPGLDLTQPRYAKHIRMKNKYSYTNDALKKYEKFTFMEGRSSDFVGADIYYDSACVPDQNSKDNTKEYKVENITTDIQFVLDNPDTNNEDVISNDGFCLIACDASDNILTEAPILENNQHLNNTLAWAHLHRDYYKHGRMMLEGYMNYNLTTFLSSIKTKQQVPLTIPLCCGDTFNPYDLVTTELGRTGEVSKATYDIISESLVLNLVFDPNEGLIGEDPVAVDDAVTVLMNTPKIINILANDYDSDGSIDPTTVLINAGGVHGTTVVNPDGTLTYTPNADYTGPDQLQYTVKDNFANTSNISLVNINVIFTLQAVDDVYCAYKDETVSITDSVINNDLGTFTLVDYETTTTQGGNVAMSSGGTFDYTPPAGFTGSDTFTYTIEDADGNQSIGTVTMNVIERVPLYVRLVQTLLETQPTGFCDPEPPTPGRREMSSIVLYFYSDAEGTAPINTDCYATEININRHTVYNHDGGSSDTVIPVNANGGTEYIYQSNIATHLSFYNCDGSYGGTDYTDTYSLLPGTGYTVI